MMSVFKKFSTANLMVSLGLAGLIEVGFDQSIKRRPSSMEEPIDLTITQLNLDPTSKLRNGVQNVYLRAVINDNMTYEWGKTEGWALAPGEKKPLEISLRIQNAWIKNDEIKFKLELVQNGFFNPVLVRCAQVSKQLSSYNRSFQCNIPGENTPLLVYRVGRKVDPAAQQTAPLQASATK